MNQESRARRQGEEGRERREGGWPHRQAAQWWVKVW
jgi:hypothetical protein